MSTTKIWALRLFGVGRFTVEAVVFFTGGDGVFAEERRWCFVVRFVPPDPEKMNTIRCEGGSHHGSLSTRRKRSHARGWYDLELYLAYTSPGAAAFDGII